MKTPQQSIDIVIPTHKKDLQILEYCIEAAKKKIVGAGRIIVISKERYSENAEWFDEALFPFSIELVQSYVGSTCGWYFQQLLKFYAPLVIPNISENVLVLDSDTVFFRRVKMLDCDGRALYHTSKDENPLRSDFDERVAKHTEKMLPELTMKNLRSEFQGTSGINHTMIFNHEILRDLFARVEKHHDCGEPFYKIFLKYAGNTHSASEYQIYFCFLLIFHRDKMRVRKLNYKNTADINIKKYRWRFKYHYCSFHFYLRGSRSNSARVKSLQFLQDFIYKFFCFEIRNIGIVNCNIGEFLHLPNRKITWMKRKNLALSYGNLSGFIGKNGERNLFSERKNLLTGETKICNLQLNEKLEVIFEKEVLKNHNLVQILPQELALVQNCESKKFFLHQIKKDGRFEHILDLPNDPDINSMSLVKRDEKWWLFFTKKAAPPNELHLAFSDDLLGKNWRYFSGNPRLLHNSTAAGTGNIFSFRGTEFRPSKNLDDSILLNRIESMTEESYQDTKEMEIFPNQLGSWPNGLCSIADLGNNLTLFSGKKFSFFPFKPLIFLFRFRLCNTNKCWTN